ncbi:MAG: V-type ATP synthase subunit I [Candidatus Rifleibacteriota bacterium]
MISPMKKLLLAAKVSDRQQVLSILKGAGVVHVDPVDPESVKLPEGLSTEIDNCNKAITTLIQIEPPQNNKLIPPGTPSRLVEEVLEHAQAIPRLREHIASLNREIEAYTPWGDLGIQDIKELQNQGVNIRLFKGPVDNFNGLEAESVEKINEIAGIAYMAIAYRNEPVIPDSLIKVDLPEKDIYDLNDEISECRHKIDEHEEALSCLSLRLEDLEKHSMKLLNKKRYSEVETGVFVEDQIFVVSGWCPIDQVETLQKSFSEANVKAGMHFEDPDEDEIPPTLLKNAPWAQSIGPLYEFMGMTPSYREPDTSGTFLLMLSLFSAFLLADAGYGLIVFLALAAAYVPLTRRNVDKNALKLGMFLFGAVALYGLFTNTWFGEHFRLIDSYKFNPNSQEGMIFLQGLCFLIGVLHLSYGHIVKMMGRQRDISLLSEVGWIAFLWAMYGVICQLILKESFPYFMPGGWDWIINTFYVSAFLILVFTAPSWNIFASILAGIGAVLKNASSCFSDVVSYIRLWAVGMAGGKVAMAFNDIAAMVPFFLLKLPIYVLGHAINIILGVIAILAHGVRLNLLEFSNHLELEWSGRKYDPFREIK